MVTEASNFDFVMMAGTGMKAADHIKSFHVNKSLVVSSGDRNSTMSNRACGSAIVIGKRFVKVRLFPPVEATGKIQGRGVGMRVANSLGDFSNGSVLPSQTERSQAAWQL